jgi:hypothetical protein
LLKKELLNKNPAKKAQTYEKSNFGKHPMQILQETQFG